MCQLIIYFTEKEIILIVNMPDGVNHVLYRNKQIEHNGMISCKSLKENVTLSKEKHGNRWQG